MLPTKIASTLAFETTPEVDRVARGMRGGNPTRRTPGRGVFDFWGGFSAFHLVWDTACVLDEGVRALRKSWSAPLVGRRSNLTTGQRRVGSRLKASPG